ncbi:hypothetical protein V1514DRAFT_330348 [Lipomyces japonicus]|uniref:uncharacterized protein n=1 Tax=Lipomyces japonicus TaxID=56871 RepID=UPI0034CE6E40
MERLPGSAAGLSRRPSLQPPSVPSPSPARNRSSRLSYTHANALKSPTPAGSIPRPASSRGFIDSASEFSIGDLVYIPSGRRGVILYIGPIAGKVGDYAGINLLGEDSAYGKNDGTVGGVKYFQPSYPTSGVFVLLNRLSLNPVVPSSNNERSSSVLEIRASSRASSRLADRSASPAPSHTNTSLQTPNRRASMANLASGRISRSAIRPPAFTPASHSKATSNQPRTSRKSILAQPVNFSDDDEGMMGVDSLHEEIVRLKRELESTSNSLLQKEADLANQSSVLRDLENTLSEFQTLSDANAINSNEDDQPPTQQELDLRTILQDKEIKINELHAELESKRQEFRETIETLEQASLATTQVYESRISELEQSITEQSSQQPSEFDDSLINLETIITELEASLEQARTTEDNFRQELLKAKADNASQNELIENLQNEISKLRVQGDAVHVNTVSTSDNDLEAERKRRETAELELHNLEKLVESRAFKEEELEKELAAVRNQLSSAQDVLQNERSAYEREIVQLKSQQNGSAKLGHETENNYSLTSKSGFSELITTNLRCQICNEEGHDIIDCKAGGYGSANGTTSFPVPSRPSPTKPVTGRKLWCALCEKDGHSSMDCPDGGL